MRSGKMRRVNGFMARCVDQSSSGGGGGVTCWLPKPFDHWPRVPSEMEHRSYS